MPSVCVKAKAAIQVLTISLLLSACRQQQSIVADYHVDVDLLRTQEISLLDFFKEIDVIPLEATDSAYLNVSCLSTYLVVEDKLIVLDRADNSIKFFNLDGKWCGTLSKYGRGPGEYAMLTDVDYNKERRSVDILDATGKILSYAFEGSFPFIRELSIPYQMKGLVNFKSSHSGYYLFSGFDSSVLRYWEPDSEGLFEVEGIPMVEQNRRAGYKTTGSPFYVFDEDIYYTDGPTGQVFRLVGKDALPHLSWNLGRFSFKSKQVDANKTGSSINELKRASNTMAGPFSAIRETSCLVFANVLFMGRGVNIIYDKLSDVTHLFTRTQEGLMFSPGFVCGKYMYFLAPPEIARQLVPEEKLSFNSQDPNYVLIKYLI